MRLKFTVKKSIVLTLTVLILGASGSVYFLLFRLGFLMSPKQIPAFLCLFCQAEKAVHPLSGNSDDLLNYQQPLKNLINQEDEVKNISILIEKSKYKLTIFNNLQAVKSYPVVFGGNPTGDKLREGDRKTPEGIYYVRDLYPHESWSKFIWLDYPRAESWREHFQAKSNGNLKWVFPIGSEIGIHGVPNESDSLIERKSNWTLGCISLKNNDVDEIYDFLDTGILVEIVP